MKPFGLAKNAGNDAATLQKSVSEAARQAGVGYTAIMDLRLRTRPISGHTEATIVEVAGDIDLHAAPGLRAELARAIESAPAPPRVVVDLGGVPFIDSTGVGVLVGALKKAREAGGELAFCGAQKRVRRVFEITGLIGALPLYPARDEALAALASVSSVSSVAVTAQAATAENQTQFTESLDE